MYILPAALYCVPTICWRCLKVAMEVCPRTGELEDSLDRPSTGFSCFSLLVAVRRAEEREIVLPNHLDVGMLCAQHPLLQRQGPLVQGFGRAIAPLGPVELRQIVEARGHSGMVGPQHPLPQRQGPRVQGFGR